MDALAVIAFMREVGLDMNEIFKTLVLVGFNFIIVGLIVWRIRKPIMKFYTVAIKAMETMPVLDTNVSNLNATLESHVKQTNERLIEGNSKFEMHSKEIKILTEQIKESQTQNARQFTEMAHQVRYLYTKLQIESSEHKDNTTQGG